MQSFAIRPGLDLCWGPAPSRPLVVAPSLLVVFLLTTEPHRGDDRMLLAHTSSPPSDADEATAANRFYVTLVLAATALHEILLDETTPAVTPVRAFAADSAAPPLSLPLSPGARLAVESIRRCPFVGAFRAMALTARAHDLLLEFLAALSAAHATPSRPPLPTRSVDDQIRTAADFLSQHLEEPPSLAALARRIGLSETTLKRGFHQVFATTVFGYLRTQRMERARALLQSGDATVLEAAALVGYSNPSNFAAAFRRQFGLNPKEFQLTARR